MDKAQGFSQSVPEQENQKEHIVSNSFQKAEKDFREEKMRLKSMQGVILVACCFNVSRDLNVDLNTNEEYYGDVEQKEIYEEALQYDPAIQTQEIQTRKVLLSVAAQIPNVDERKQFILTCSHAGMMRLFDLGQKEVILEYRRWTQKGLIWVSTRVVLIQDPSTRDIMAFYYTSDINQEVIYRKITEQVLYKYYDTVFYYDLHQKKTYFMSSEQSIHISFSEMSYEEAIERVVCPAVSDKDRKEIRQKHEIGYILARLKKEAVYSMYYMGSHREMSMPGHPYKRLQTDVFFLDEQQDILVFLRSNVTRLYAQERKNHEMMQDALHAAEQANHAKSEFLSRISHDIRTPISIISSMTDFAFQDIQDGKKLKEDLEKIKSANAFLLSLINDVLDISKIDSGKIELNAEPYSYEEHSANIYHMLKTMCDEKGLHMIMERRRKTGVIVADKIRMNQITLNLLSNAVKYTPQGGTITYISDSEDLPDNKIRFGLEIHDTGIGMSEEFQKKMFEPFAQEYDNPHRPKGITGTGLGLSIVKTMIDLMGGTLQIQSRLGKGTMIRCDIVFPDALRDPRYQFMMKDQSSFVETRRTLSGKVLLAEDNSINTEIAVRILSNMGLAVDCVDNGVKAVEHFQASVYGEYKAILMDIQMPIMNGYEATQQIRSLKRPDAARIPIIAMTADAFSDAAKKGMQAGMNEYLLKPLDSEKIWSALKDL